jgi:hypothetical protein
MNLDIVSLDKRREGKRREKKMRGEDKMMLVKTRLVMQS